MICHKVYELLMSIISIYILLCYTVLPETQHILCGEPKHKINKHMRIGVHRNQFFKFRPEPDPTQPRTQGILLPVSENGPGIGRSHDLKISSIWGVQL
jgi:hypothetical protein